MNIVYPEPQKTFTGCDEWCIPLHLVEKAVGTNVARCPRRRSIFRDEDERSLASAGSCRRRCGSVQLFLRGPPPSSATDASESVVPPLRYWGHVRTL